MAKTFYIYHTNDLHSHFTHWSKTITYLKETTHGHHEAGESVLQFDIGDHVDLFDPMSEGTQGRGNVQLLNEAGYDAVTIGNNEGITLSKTALDHLYDDAKFSVIVANLYEGNGQRPSWAKSYEIFRLENGVSVATIGITIPFYDYYEPLGWQIIEPSTILPSLVKKVKKEADVVVLCSHMGVAYDKQIAAEIPEIDIILGAHTHHVLNEGLHIENTMIGQAGKFGQYVGKMKVIYDDERQCVKNIEAKTVNITNDKADEKTDHLLSRLTETGKSNLNATVTELAKPLHVSWLESSPLTTLLAEALKEWCAADVAIVNAGMLLESLPEGIVTKDDIHRICPHPINPCKVQITGQQLVQIISTALDESTHRLEIKGLGFRGKVFGMCVFAGAEVVVGSTRDGRLHVHIQGAPIEREKSYAVAIPDMYYLLSRVFPNFSESLKKQFYVPETLRDLLAWKLTKQGE